MKMDRTGRRANLLMARAAESNYRSRLLQVSKQVDLLIRGMAGSGPEAAERLQQTLRQYAALLNPWAQTVARYMVAEVARRNLKGFGQVSVELSRGIVEELENAPTGSLYARMMGDQVDLITSLPLQAAQRVHDLTTKAMTTGYRADTIASEILRTGEVTAARARLIARTEVSRTASNFTQARARYAGSDGYIWRTSGDGDVRPTHRAMNGKYVPWDQPPKTDPGLDPYHAGCGPNCRCYPDPVLPD